MDVYLSACSANAYVLIHAAISSILTLQSAFYTTMYFSNANPLRNLSRSERSLRPTRSKCYLQ